MKKLIIGIFVLGILGLNISTGEGYFRTGCRHAKAANFTSETYSFIIMEGVVFSNINPANGAANIDTNKPIEFDVTHALPILNVSVEVFSDGNTVSPDSVKLTPITNGFHVVFTPATSYPIYSTVTWRATATVEGN